MTTGQMVKRVWSADIAQVVKSLERLKSVKWQSYPLHVPAEPRFDLFRALLQTWIKAGMEMNKSDRKKLEAVFARLK